MKKILILLLVLLMSASTLVSCGKHPIEEFKEQMDSVDNYLMTMTMKFPSVGNITVAQKIDGNIMYTPAFLTEPAKYTEVVDDVTYEYVKDDNGAWKKSIAPPVDNGLDMLFNEAFFDPDNYEKVNGEKNSYRQKEDVAFAGASDVVITIGKNNYTLEMKLSVSGVEMETTVVLSNFGEVELTLPNVE